MARRAAKPKQQKPMEQTLWDAANKLRGKVEPAEYKHVVLSLIFFTQPFHKQSVCFSLHI